MLAKSYDKWQKLSEFQAKNVVETWGKLTEQGKTVIPTAAIARASPLRASVNTTKNDYVRLLELRMLPSVPRDWSKALGNFLRYK